MKKGFEFGDMSIKFHHRITVEDMNNLGDKKHAN
jgi:hypothetical protein